VIAQRKIDVLAKLELKSQEYFLVTSHRQENVDSQERLSGIIQGLKFVCQEFSITIIFPIHPRTRETVEKFGLKPNGIEVIEPVGFLEFLQLEANAGWC
jgi:UDP-N-acetylglucosamine 2-epimerase (non-hydrolysing)